MLWLVPLINRPWLLVFVGIVIIIISFYFMSLFGYIHSWAILCTVLGIIAILLGFYYKKKIGSWRKIIK